MPASLERCSIEEGVIGGRHLFKNMARLAPDQSACPILRSYQRTLGVELGANNRLGNGCKMRVMSEEQDLSGAGHFGQHLEACFSPTIIEVYEEVVG